MATIVSIQQGGTGANNASDAVNALGTIANTGGIFTGEVQFTGPNNSINVANSALISGVLAVQERGLFGNGIIDHLVTQNIDSTSISVGGLIDSNGAGEIMAINKSNGSLAYAEFIALNDKGDQDQGWISVGINSSEYNDPDYTLTGPDDGYLLFEAPLNSNANGDLIIGTGSYGQNNRLVLAAGGFAPTDAQLVIAPADLKKAEIVNSELISNTAILTTANTHTFEANDEVLIASVGAPYDGTFTISSVSSNTIQYSLINSNLGSAAANGTATQVLPFNKGTVELTAQLFVGENSKSTFTTANLTLENSFAIPLGVVVDNDGPGQVSMFNKSNGEFAYSEFIAQNDVANSEMGWVSFGINSSGYDDPEFPITKADDAYLLYEPPAGTTGDGDLIIGTGTNGTKNRLIFAAEGFDEANAQMIITPNESVRIAINTDSTSANTGALQVEGGIGVQGSVFVQGNQTIQGDLIVNGTQTIQSIDSVAASGPLSILGDGNSANTWDFGVVGTYAISKSSSIQAITNKSLANNSATLTTANNHSFSVEDIATITGVDATFNGVHRITAVTSNTFSYFKLANNISSTAATGNVSVGLTTKYTGIVKDTANATWKLLSNIEARPAFNINLANTSLDNLRVATINANNIVTATGVDVSGIAANAVLRTGDTMTGQLNVSSGGLLVTGNVGIGTTNPSKVLHTFSSSESLLVDGSATWGGAIQIKGGGGANTWQIQSTGSGAGEGANKLIFGQKDISATLMTITSAGNVGIGTTNPLQKLHVNGPKAIIDDGSGTNIGLSVGTTSSSTGTLLGCVDVNGDAYSAYYTRTGDVLRGKFLQISTTRLEIGTIQDVPVQLHVNDNAVATITSTGVGIGTTNPGQKLHVLGIIRSNTSSTTGFGATEILNDLNTMVLQIGMFGSARSGTTFGLNNANLAFMYTTTYSSGHPSALAIGTSSSQPLVFGTNGSERMRITDTGNVGIGTSNPQSAALAIFGDLNPSGTGLSFGHANTAGYKWIQSFNSQPLYINPLGNNTVFNRDGGGVGIGTTNPLVKFHVAGASIIANNTAIDPDSYASQTVAGAIADGSGWGVTSAIGGNAGTGDSWAIGHNGSGLFMGMQNGSAADTMQTYIQFDPNRNLYLVPTSGNIGVGTNVPAYGLHINKTNPEALGVFRGLDVGSVGAAGTYIELGALSGSSPIAGARITGVLNSNATTGYIAIATLQSSTMKERMFISSGGNVGVNTNNPSTKLDVWGDDGGNGAVRLVTKTSGTGSYQQIWTVSNTGSTVNDAIMQLFDGNTARISMAANAARGGDTYFNTGGGFVVNAAVRAVNSPLSFATPGAGIAKPTGLVIMTPNGVDGNYDNILKYAAYSDATGSGQALDRWIGIDASITAGSAGANVMRFMVYNGGTTGAPINVAYFTGAGQVFNNGNSSSWNTTSDERIKENIATLNNAIQKILGLRPVTFDYTEEFSLFKQWKGSERYNNTGFIAQEYEQILPDHVSSDEMKINETEYEDLRSLSEGKLIPYLVKAIQEQQLMIDNLKSRLDELENK